MTHDAWAELGVATVYEAAGRRGLIAGDLVRVLPQSRVAGPARTVLCAQGDNLAVHVALEHAKPGDVLVITMPDPEPVALVGDVIALQAKTSGVAGLLVDAAVRDRDDLIALGLPIWSRWIHACGATKTSIGRTDSPITVGGEVIAPGDLVILDGDGGAVVPPQHMETVLEAARRRRDSEEAVRARLAGGEVTMDLLGLRASGGCRAGA